MLLLKVVWSVHFEIYPLEMHTSGVSLFPYRTWSIRFNLASEGKIIDDEWCVCVCIVSRELFHMYPESSLYDAAALLIKKNIHRFGLNKQSHLFNVSFYWVIS